MRLGALRLDEARGPWVCTSVTSSERRCAPSYYLLGGCHRVDATIESVLARPLPEHGPWAGHSYSQPCMKFPFRWQTTGVVLA